MTKSNAKTAATTTPATKSDMIRLLKQKGLSTGEIRTAVMEVYATCYYPEITRAIKVKVPA